MDLERLLIEMSRYGKVRIGQYGTSDRGWHCSMEVFIAGDGIALEVKSDHSSANLTPLQAATQCSERLVALMNEMKEKSKNTSLATLGLDGVASLRSRP
jgi:hypothetical protein